MQNPWFHLYLQVNSMQQIQGKLRSEYGGLQGLNFKMCNVLVGRSWAWNLRGSSQSLLVGETSGQDQDGPCLGLVSYKCRLASPLQTRVG